MHIPMVLYGYNIHAFTLPFSTHHPPSLRSDYVNTMGKKQWQEYNTREQRQKALLTMVHLPKATNLLWTTHLHSQAQQILLPPWLWIYLLSWQRLSERNQGFYF